jgi:hypothetical protein
MTPTATLPLKSDQTVPDVIHHTIQTGISDLSGMNLDLGAIRERKTANIVFQRTTVSLRFNKGPIYYV